MVSNIQSVFRYLEHLQNICTYFFILDARLRHGLTICCPSWPETHYVGQAGLKVTDIYLLALRKAPPYPDPQMIFDSDRFLI